MAADTFLGILKRRFLPITVASILVALLVFGALTLFVAPTYQATAKMIVNAGSDSSASLTITNDQITTSQKLVDTYGVIIRSRTVLNQVIDTLSLDINYEQLYRKVHVSSVNGTQIMEIAVQDPSPENARKIVQAITKIAPKELSHVLKASSVETIDQSYASKKPVAPNKALYSMISFVLTAILMTLVFVLQYMNDGTFRSEEELTEELNMPVLACIPSGNRKRRRA